MSPPQKTLSEKSNNKLIRDSQELLKSDIKRPKSINLKNSENWKVKEYSVTFISYSHFFPSNNFVNIVKLHFLDGPEKLCYTFTKIQIRLLKGIFLNSKY